MRNILEFLNNNSGAFSVLFSALVAAATLVYAFLTAKLVRETTHMREAQTEPRLSVYLTTGEQWISSVHLFVENIGLGPAYDIRFSLESDFECHPGFQMSEIGFIKQGIKYLAPRGSRKTFFTSLTVNGEKKLEMTLRVMVLYKNVLGKVYADHFDIDFREFKNTRQLGQPPIYKIAGSLEDIAKDFHSVASGSSKLRVLRYTMEEYEKEQQEMLDYYDHVESSKTATASNRDEPPAEGAR